MKSVVGTLFLLCVLACSASAYSGRLFSNGTNTLAKFRLAERAHNLPISLLTRYLDYTSEKAQVWWNIPSEIQQLGLYQLGIDLATTGLIEPLSNLTNKYTVFGPTNEAFASLPADIAKRASEDIDFLRDVLKYHVLSAVVMSTGLEDDLTVTTKAGKPLRINLYPNGVDTVQCAPIDLTRVDELASNGVIHVLKKVMIPPAGNILESLRAQKDKFSTLITAIETAGLTGVLEDSRPLTMFAPTNDAFKKLPPGMLEKLLKDVKSLAVLLTYHAVHQTYCSAGLTNVSISSLTGLSAKVHIKVSSDGVEVNDAKVVIPDISVTNGVIHAIDTVLMPPKFLEEQFGGDVNIPKLAENLGLTTLVKDVIAAGLAPVLSRRGRYTVFGPTNEAFADLPADIKKLVSNVTILGEVLKYHVLYGNVPIDRLRNDILLHSGLGGKIRFNKYDKDIKTVQCAPLDLKRVHQKASNGLINVIDKVMIPPPGNMVEVVGSMMDRFSTLVTAVKAAGLVDTLSENLKPLTLFAPTDKAFRRLPEGTVEKLLKDKKALTAVLTYHVVKGTYCSAGLSSKEVPTVNGASVKIQVGDGGVKVNDAQVVTADVSVTNGVIHVIDRVLLPPTLF